MIANSKMKCINWNCGCPDKNNTIRDAILSPFLNHTFSLMGDRA
jgi:hypothetical protein